MFDAKTIAKAHQSHKKLTLRERRAIQEYIKTGNKTAAVKAVYKTGKYPNQMANNFFRKPKIKDALEKALKDKGFTDSYAVEVLKKITDAGLENLEITRPDTSLKALETFFKITNKMGGGNKVAIKMDIDAQAKKMDVSQLQAGLKELDKRQKRILAIIGGSEDGEIVK